jgi:inner membrane protein
MPSPIAHLGAGYAIYRYSKRKLPENQGQLWKLPFQMIMVMGLSMLPDLDIIPAMIFRDMEKYHNNFSHSLLLAIPVAILIAAILRQIYHSDFWAGFLICLISYDFHIVMDALTAERGVIMFWPLSQNRFTFPIKVFYGVQWGLGWFSIWHLWTIFTESLFVLVVVSVVNYFEKRRKKVNPISFQEN